MRDPRDSGAGGDEPGDCGRLRSERRRTPTSPMRSDTSRTAVNGTRRTAVVPAAIPAATAGVVSRRGRDSRRPSRRRRRARSPETRARPEPGAERKGVAARPLATTRRTKTPATPRRRRPATRLTREEDEVDGPVGGRAKATASAPTASPATTSSAAGLRPTAPRCHGPGGDHSDDERGDDDGHEQAPGQVGEAHALVRRERRQREIRLVQPSPARDPAREDERPVPRPRTPAGARDRSAGADLPARRVTSNRRNAAINGPPKSAATAAKAPERARSRARFPPIG